jgi:putative endonuclease
MICPSDRSRRSEASKDRRVAAGAMGERLAEEYLVRYGYQIVARNWRAPETRNEIDLIVEDRGCLVFVEVKRTWRFGDPLWKISPRKQRAVINAASAYIAMHHPPHSEFRFDAVVIAPPGPDGERALRHIPAAFTLDSANPE